MNAQTMQSHAVPFHRINTTLPLGPFKVEYTKPGTCDWVKVKVLDTAEEATACADRMFANLWSEYPSTPFEVRVWAVKERSALPGTTITNVPVEVH